MFSFFNFSKCWSIVIRVRTILALGYLVLGNICRYWVVLLLGDIFFIVTPSTMSIRKQSAPSHDNHLETSVVRLLSAGRVGREVERKLYIVTIQFCDFTRYSVVCILLQLNALPFAMLHTSIGIGIGYWYH